MADTSVKQQIVDKIKDSNNVLVTVNSNPSVDELSAALGITLLINKLNKHATAVFSGAIPSAIEFLEPEKTFENTVNSLRDFIIALDKEKADHLRYKVVDDMVKIFITPYRTTINENDLDFSQGDYNVEMVLAIGVKKEQDMDKALESHGRILHDATVAAISLDTPSNLGGIEWVDSKASSYSEMLVALADALKNDKRLIDEQISTAFLTGIVAATDRFSNEKTSANVMTVAAELMAAGANQQLIAIKLEEGNSISASAPALSSDGELREGESTKVNRVEESVPLKPAKASDGSGALTISHYPEGDVDEVAAQVAADNSQQAANRAEEELAKHTAAAEPQDDAAEAAEQKLAEQLAATAPVAPSLPTAADFAAPGPAIEPLRGAVPSQQWRAHADTEAGEPTLGGTLNATTEQAEEAKRQELADDRNRTILSHGGGGYIAGEPTYQAPLNAAMDDANKEPEVRDIFASGAETDTTAHANAIQPPMPTVPAPTLAEIDQQNRHHSDAMSAVNAAFDSPVSAPTTPFAQPVAPELPPLPPMPDFSTLPPLPGAPAPEPTPADLATPMSVHEELGNLLPPLPERQPVIGSNPADPAQFKIPGQ